jgi:two-component system cell cycle response regulator DivK
MGRHVSPRVPTVLLVDNCHDDRQMYAEYLRFQQFRVIEIDNTADALALAPTSHVVVTGIRVPGPFDGIDLVRRIRAHEQTTGMPIIVVSACAFESDRQRAYDAGCEAFLPKPCLPDRLLEEIHRVLIVRGKPLRPMRVSLDQEREEIA